MPESPWNILDAANRLLHQSCNSKHCKCTQTPFRLGKVRILWFPSFRVWNPLKSCKMDNTPVFGAARGLSLKGDLRIENRHKSPNACGSRTKRIDGAGAVKPTSSLGSTYLFAKLDPREVTPMPSIGLAARPTARARARLSTIDRRCTAETVDGHHICS